jgi:HSP20 family protein
MVRAMRDEQRQRRSEGAFTVGLGGIFKNLGDMISLLAEIAEREDVVFERTGEVRGERLRAVYGFNIRTGLNGDLRVERFGNLRSTAAGPAVTPVREPLVDVFDEGETIVVIAELPGVDESEVRVEARGDVLSLETTGERRYAREILLPALVVPDTLRQTYRNGILELRLTRQP